MESRMADPRVYFAAERTLLAWTRTGITIIALGFVVSRFALFLRLVVQPDTAVAGGGDLRWMSDLLGVSLVLIGSGVIALARYDHVAFVRSLPPQDVPAMGLPWLSSALAFALSILGFVMAIFLAIA